jgi:hypothetical protein
LKINLSNHKTVDLLRKKKVAKVNRFVYFHIGRDYSAKKSATAQIARNVVRHCIDVNGQYWMDTENLKTIFSYESKGISYQID